jgi:hypothetical protein
MTRRGYLGLAPVFLLGGCFLGGSATGRELSREDLAKIEMGASKRAQVLTLLGTPSLDTITPAEEILAYEYEQDHAWWVAVLFLIIETTSHRTEVVLDQEGIVREIRQLPGKDR